MWIEGREYMGESVEYEVLNEVVEGRGRLGTCV
jgi:hypothetical protein